MVLSFFYSCPFDREEENRLELDVVMKGLP